MHSKQWHYSLHRDFQNCYSTRRSPTGFFSSNSSSNSTRIPIHHPHLHVHPENSPSRLQFYMQKTESSSSTTTTTTYRGQRDLHSRFQKRNSTHRRQRDLLEMHPCVTRTFQAFQPQDLPKAFQSFQSFQTFQTFQLFQIFRTFQSIMTFQPFQAILQVPVFPGNPTHYSILQLECIFYIFYNSTVRLVSRKLHRVPVGQLQTTNIHSSKKGRCCDIGQN